MHNQVPNGSPAALAGLQIGDRILVLGTLDSEAINKKVCKLIFPIEPILKITYLVCNYLGLH